MKALRVASTTTRRRTHGLTGSTEQGKEEAEGEVGAAQALAADGSTRNVEVIRKPRKEKPVVVVDEEPGEDS